MRELPTASEWEHGKFSIGELMTRQRFASELAGFMLAISASESRHSKQSAGIGHARRKTTPVCQPWNPGTILITSNIGCAISAK